MKLSRILGPSLLAAAASAPFAARADSTKATGGIVTKSATHVLHTFSAPGTYTFIPSEALIVDVLIVGGGGGGGPSGGGGGGGGEVLQVNSLALSADTEYTVVVGDGGSCPATYYGQALNGQSSFFDSYEAIGGGGGGAWNQSGADGANGGGGTIWGTKGGKSTAVSGHKGGDGNGGVSPGGGGGAGGDGGTCPNWCGPCGDGGPGLGLDFTGTVVYYGAGGGGGSGSEAVRISGAGGSGVGGDGSVVNSGLPGGNGMEGTGSGGGGGSSDETHSAAMCTCGGDGGCGVVIVRYAGETDSPDPVLGAPGSSNVSGDTATVSGAINSLGTGASAATVYMVYGPQGGESATTNLVGTYNAAPSAFSFGLTGLVPATTYGFFFFATNSLGGVAESSAGTFNTLGASVLSAGVTATLKQPYVTLSGSLAVLGAGTTTVYLRLGPDADHLETVAEQVLTQLGSFSNVWEYAFSNSYAYAFVSTNVCGGSAWSSETSVGTFDGADKTTYIWSVDTDGDWNNPDNWFSFGDNEKVGYPTFGAIAQFSAPNQVEGEPRVEKTYTVSIKQPEFFDQLNVGGEGCHVVFTTDSMDNLFRFRASYLPATYATMEFVGISVQEDEVFNPVQGTRVVYRDGTIAMFRREYMGNAVDSLHLVSDGSLLSVGENLWVAGPASTFIISNATVMANGHVAARAMATGAGVVRFEGTNPVLRAAAGFSSWDNDAMESPVFEFNVPQDGFLETPISIVEGNETLMLDNWTGASRPAVKFSIAPESRAIFSSHSVDQLLVDWSNGKGIDTRYAVFGTVPNPNTDYFYWMPANLEEGQYPTQLWVHIASTGNTLILIR